MAADCCTKTYDLGCFNCCQKFVELPFSYPSTGEFRAWYKYAGRRLVRVLDGVSGQPVIVPITGLNEEFSFYGYITDPDGDRVTFTVGGVSFDCFQFRIHEGAELQPEPINGTCSGVDILDNLGNIIAHVADGGTYTITPMIIPYADEAAALADTTTIPTTAQLVVLNDTDRTFHGNGTSTVAALVTAKRFLLPVTETVNTLQVDTNGETLDIQLNEP